MFLFYRTSRATAHGSASKMTVCFTFNWTGDIPRQNEKIPLLPKMSAASKNVRMRTFFEFLHLTVLWTFLVKFKWNWNFEADIFWRRGQFWRMPSLFYIWLVAGFLGRNRYCAQAKLSARRMSRCPKLYLWGLWTFFGDCGHFLANADIF